VSHDDKYEVKEILPQFTSATKSATTASITALGVDWIRSREKADGYANDEALCAQQPIEQWPAAAGDGLKLSSVTCVSEERTPLR
jgi:hypothetical protein